MVARTALAMMFCLLFGNAACAQLIDAKDPKALAAAIQDMGYKAKLETGKDGDPVLLGRHLGYNYRAFFYGCKENINCSSITFRAGKITKNRPFPLEKLNKWALSKRVGIIFVDGEGDPNIKFTINLTGGVSKENFEDSFDSWHVVLADFDKLVDQ